MEDNNFHVLPGWETVRTIGNGSSGKVYELIKKDEYGGDLHSALKIISIPATKAEYEEMQSKMSESMLRTKLREKVEEISNEYRLMGVLKGHPNVVSCEDQMIVPHTDDLGWDIYIRMELLTSLPEYVHEHGITGTEVMKLCMDICSALEACRKNGIIHRDIKPQNIFVSPYGVFKLGDFGVAKATSMGSIEKVGTYSYMAPEVYKGKVYNDSVDIYSLGMVLYWLLNERRGPFLPLPPETPTNEHIANAQLRRNRGEAIPEPKHGNDAMKKLVVKACSFRPEDRFQSPTDMKKALAMAAKGKVWEPPAVSEDEPTVREEIKKPPVQEPVKRAEPPKTRPVVQPQPMQKPQHSAQQTQPKPKPRPKTEEREEKKGASAYAVILVLLIVAMLAAIIIFFTSDGDLFDIFDRRPVSTAEPAPTPSPTPDIVSVILSSPTLTVKEGMGDDLTVSCIPDSADNNKLELVWKSSNYGIVDVDEKGHIEGVSPGTATVRVYVADKMEVYDECIVTVEKASVTKIVIEQEPEITRYSIGDELDITGLVIRAYYDNDTAKRITDPNEFEVSGDLNGLGNRTITVKYDGATAEFSVWVGLF